MQRNTATRDRHRRTIAATKPPCWICGRPIDYTLPHLNPNAYVVDHVIPLAQGGTDTIDNKRAAHRACNRAKGARIHAPIIRRSATLARPPNTQGKVPLRDTRSAFPGIGDISPRGPWPFVSGGRNEPIG